MHAPEQDPLFAHRGIALLRAAAVSLSSSPPSVPDLTDVDSCRSWLAEVWAQPGFALAVDQASNLLRTQVIAALTGRLPAAKVRRVTESITRYLLRATGRPTPFGLFAGVAPVTVEPVARARWGTGHRPVARVDTLWLGEVLDGLEREPMLLRRLDVVFNSLVVVRGGHLEVPSGPNRVLVRFTSAVRAACEAATAPVGFSTLAYKLADTFGASETTRVEQLLAGLVEQRVLITSLRALTTVTDPLGHLIRRLRAVGASTLGPVAAQCEELAAIRDALTGHNTDAQLGEEQSARREAIIARIRKMSPAGRTALAVDLRLDCTVAVPVAVLSEVARAADVLIRLTRRPTGGPAWRAYHAAFCDRYGVGTLVPLTDAVNPDTGLGFPAGYPGTRMPIPVEPATRRDEMLLALAWRAVNNGSREVTLTGDIIASLTDERFDVDDIPAHVEVAARILAPDTDAIGRGEYTLIVAPARACGTLTSRFTELATGSGLEQVFAEAPATTRDALRVQLSVPPVYPHAENVGRVPAYLPHVLSLGEHPGDDTTTIGLDDLALTASRDRLHLVSVSRRRPVEVQLFHALALEKQLPPLARFLAHLPRAFSARWHEFDWGPHAHLMPYLPRLRAGRAVIAPARWRLTSPDLPPADCDETTWRTAFDQWRTAWQCPDSVELRTADRTLRLDTGAPAHLAMLRAHLDREGDATLVETASAADYGWIGGHVHEIAVPLTATAPPRPAIRVSADPPLSNARHGHLPGSPDGRWLSAKLFTHPDRHDEILTAHLPRLLDSLAELDVPDGNTGWYFLRYRSPHEPDHLRLRLRTTGPGHYGRLAALVGTWARQLRARGDAGNLLLDTYYPEVGRYGHGPALDAAEAVFATDSRTVLAGLRNLPRLDIDPVAFAALNMVEIARAFTGTTADAIQWLINTDCPPGPRLDRQVLTQALRLARTDDPSRSAGWRNDIGAAWHGRAHALHTYRRTLPDGADRTAILESLLHMHHNRALGIDPDREAGCRRLARQAALAMRAQHAGADR